jgi:hypothetical protein
MYNNLTKMFVWCNGHSYEYVFYQVDGYCHVYAEYNRLMNKEELVCVGVKL